MAPYVALPPWLSPAGQAAPPPAPAPVATPIQPPTTGAPPIDVGPDGRIVGVDGMLDQIASALANQAGPMLARDVLPVLQRDTAMQATVGGAAGRELGRSLRGPLYLIGGALAVLAAVAVYRAVKA